VLHAFQMSRAHSTFSPGITKMPTSMIKTRKAGKTNCFNLKLRTGFGTFTFPVYLNDDGGFFPPATSLDSIRRELVTFSS